MQNSFLIKNNNFPNLILYLHGAAAFQYLHAGASFELFELLHKYQACSQSFIALRLKLLPASVRCLLFGLTVLKLINNDNKYYKNSKIIEKLFKNGEWDMFRKWVRLEAAIMYVGQQDFVPSLKYNRNVGLRHFSGNGKTIYDRLNYNPHLRKIFYDYMRAYSTYAFSHLLKAVNFSTSRHMLDIGGGDGTSAILLAQKYPHLKITLVDLPATQNLALRNINRHNLPKQIKFFSADIFKNGFPGNQDCILFIHQLVIWNQKQNLLLLKKAYKALSKSGRVIIFSSIAEDSEDGPLMAALDTAYFKAIAAGEGMIYPWKDYERILRQTGFRKIKKIRCKTWTPHGIIIAFK